MVMERGGYDKVSDERMAWRQLVKPLGFGHQAEGAATFQIKSLYYRNLVYVPSPLSPTATLTNHCQRL